MTLKHIAVLAYDVEDFFQWAFKILPDGANMSFMSGTATYGNDRYVYIDKVETILGMNFSGYSETVRFLARDDAQILRHTLVNRKPSYPPPDMPARRYCVISPTAYKRTWFDTYDEAKEHAITILREKSNPQDTKLFVVLAEGVVECERPSIGTRPPVADDFVSALRRPGKAA